ncbi:hypothetical protein ABPG72_018094 [Tetrahymena utriculariae]
MAQQSQNLREKICNYMQDIAFVTAYQFGFLKDENNIYLVHDQKLKKQLRIDSLKCMLVTSVIFIGYRFSKGRNHYTNYLKSFMQGQAAGYVISIYYTREKMKEQLVLKQIEKSQNSRKPK